MIQLAQEQKPKQLTEKRQAQFVKKYKKDKSSVWRRKYIQDALRKSSSNKCAYCETDVSVKAQYMEVEHYYCQHHFSDLVVDWDNLLPSCKRCNNAKSDHNVAVEPLINPYFQNPADHIEVQGYSLVGKDSRGKAAVKVIHLNDSDRLIPVRVDIEEELNWSLVQIAVSQAEYAAGYQSAEKLCRIVEGIIRLLKMAQPKIEFSAIIATFLLRNPDYNQVVTWLRSQNLMSAEAEALEKTAKAIAL